MSDHGYNRPNQRWLCGLESETNPCSTGPTCGGRCPALGECAPVRDGDRWVCNRSAGRGGPCEVGPTPEGQCCRVRRCKPKRSLRVIRGRWLRGAALFTIGAVLMLLGAESRNELAAPGELSSHHAQVIARADWSNRCAACHPGANAGPTTWLTAAWHGAGEAVDEQAVLTQSALCLDCHRDMAGGDEAALLAHGLPEGELGAVAGQRAALSLVAWNPTGAPARGRSSNDPLACAVCHQEHHGAGHDLTAITDARCQACHTDQFTSFAADHPEFGLWPTARRTRIAFNHASHGAQHFLKANREFDCRSCHQEDAAGDLTTRPDYHAACAVCHDGDIVTSFGEGLTFLSLPTIDPEAIDAGRWPRNAQGDFDGELPAFTKLLLASDARTFAAMQTLGEDFSFLDVDPDDPEQVQAATTIVEALQRLLDETQEEGHGAIAYRLRRLLEDRVTIPEADYVARLPVELIDRIQATWLGTAQPPEGFDAVEDRRTGGGWSIDDDRLTLLYRPTGHDDPLLRAWLDAIVALPAPYATLREVSLAEFTRPGAPGRCLECHSLEETGDRLTINWRGRDRLNEPRGFTRFSHRPHLVQPELANCTHCHAIDDAADPSAAYVGSDPTRFASEFVGFTKAACTSCHQPHAAGDSCTQCHNYHVDSLHGP